MAGYSIVCNSLPSVLKLHTSHRILCATHYALFLNFL